MSKVTFTKTQLPKGRMSGCFADKVEVVIRGDYGADMAAVSEDHLVACNDSGIFV